MPQSARISASPSTTSPASLVQAPQERAAHPVAAGAVTHDAHDFTFSQRLLRHPVALTSAAIVVGLGGGVGLGALVRG
ncbi:hypothetical protein [Paraoerskovia marina]|uniref:hypothetical protein n=1 Tax=Paraoerskovia marina TaxID=545619 RepID=UPI0012DF119B|nr:hypothetical protein [Paraoerskovia marina]